MGRIPASLIQNADGTYSFIVIYDGQEFLASSGATLQTVLKRVARQVIDYEIGKLEVQARAKVKAWTWTDRSRHQYRTYRVYLAHARILGIPSAERVGYVCLAMALTNTLASNSTATTMAPYSRGYNIAVMNYMHTLYTVAQQYAVPGGSIVDVSKALKDF